MQLASKNNAFGRQSHNFRFVVGYLSKNKQVSNAKQLEKKCFIVNELLLYKINNVYLQNNTTIIPYSMRRQRENDEKQFIR